jgi:tRNA nucleotidyltransferase (CCA-adding enzyme)
MTCGTPHELALPPVAELRARVPLRLLEISDAIAQRGGVCYLVGGWVRDTLLGLPCKDLDVEVHHLPESDLAAVLRRFGRPSQVGRAFGILLMRVDELQVDFALPRTERKTGSGHKGFDVETDPELGFSAASARRDFTINAMGMRLPDFFLEDPHGGLTDLQARRLRHVGPAFGEDPLRALRAAQFIARFGLTLAPETRQICSEQELSELAPERLDEEFHKLLLKAAHPSLGLQALRDTELLRFFPELNPQGDEASWKQLLRTVDRAAALKEMAYPALQDPRARHHLLHLALCSEMPIEPGIRELGSSAATRSPFATGVATAALAFTRRLTLDVALLEAVGQALPLVPLVGEAFAKPASIPPDLDSTSAVQRPDRPWVRRLSLACPPSFPLDLLVALLECREDAPDKSNSQASPVAPEASPVSTRLRDLATEASVLESRPQPWLQGRELIRLGMRPSPAMGELLREAFELQLDEQLADADAALRWARDKLK